MALKLLVGLLFCLLAVFALAQEDKPLPTKPSPEFRSLQDKRPPIDQPSQDPVAPFLGLVCLILPIALVVIAILQNGHKFWFFTGAAMVSLSLFMAVYANFIMRSRDMEAPFIFGWGGFCFYFPLGAICFLVGAVKNPRIRK